MPLNLVQFKVMLLENNYKIANLDKSPNLKKNSFLTPIKNYFVN